jgi:saccharopepsin
LHILKPSISVADYIKPQLNLSHELGYFTTITLGTPSQHFSVMLDISASDIFVRDYHSASSSTHCPNDTSVSVGYGSFFTSGSLSEDVLRMGSLEIGRQLFQEANTATFPEELLNSLKLIRGVLGLAPSILGSAYNSPNPSNTQSRGI